MDLVSLSNIKKFCKKNNIKPSRKRGQNFLVDEDVLEKIVQAADIKKDDEILEIGAGFGVLTQELAIRAKKVIAVEVDKGIIPILQDNLREFKNIEILEDDILRIGDKLDISSYKYKIIANLPYQITSLVLRSFLENKKRPKEMVLMVQKEVAERICAQKGEMSLLAVSVQFFGKPEIIEIVSKNSFYPVPEVDSAILRISNIEKVAEGNMKKVGLKDFFQVAKVGFSAKRKQLHNNLANCFKIESEDAKNILEDTGLSQKARAQELSISDWINLTKRIKNNA